MAWISAKYWHDELVMPRLARFRPTLAALAVAACLGAGLAQANPTNPVVANGAASFTQAGNLLQINNSPNAIINWGSFSIGANEITRFIQQSSASAVLNRVGAGRDPSSILGALQSNGRVFLINPNGITFGAGSQINVAGLVASTLNMSDADFLAGRMRFTDGLGNSVINNGNITTSSGGSVYLVGNAVTNNGIITSPKGEVILAAGNSVELVNPGTPDLRVEITAPDNQAINLGDIVANSGRIGIYAGLINHSGTLNANSVDVDAAGNITLRATKSIDLAQGSSITANGPSGGNVTVQSGDTTLAAGSIEARGSAGQGGQINVLGNLVGLTGNATLDASGQTGGGTVLIGGDYQGKNANIQNAFRTYMGPDAAIKADAITSGDGGKVIVWGDDVTRAYGSISARGGTQSGNGGFVETSGHSLDVAGIRVDAGSVNGGGGTWLLDPDNIQVVAGAGTTNNVGVPSFTPNGSNSQVGADLITGQLNAGTSVTLNTTGAAADAGNIDVNAPIAKTAGAVATLSLLAENNININSPISGNMNLVLTPANVAASTGVANIAADINVPGGTITASNGFNITLNNGVFFSGSPTITAASLQMDRMTIGSGTTVTLNANTSVQRIDMTGGTLTGSGNIISVGGIDNFANATISGSGTLFTAPDSPVAITGPIVVQRNWISNSDINITGNGSINIDGPIQFAHFFGNPLGTGNVIQIASTAAQQIFGTGTFVNNGIVEVATHGNTAVIATATYNNAVGSSVDLSGGSLRISASGSDAANYNFGFGQLEFAGGVRTFTGGGINGGSGGAGTLVVSGGSVTIPAATSVSMNTVQVTGGGTLTVDSSAARSYTDVTISGANSVATFNGAQINFTSNLTMQGGTLTGTADFNFNNSSPGFTWSGGTIAGSGTLTTGIASSTVTIDGPVTLARNWINGTDVNLNNPGSITINAPATLTNNANFNLASSAAAPIAGSGTFLNTGTLSETSNANINIQSNFVNQGAVNLSGGGVTALGASTGSDSALYRVGASDTLAFNGDRTFTGGGVSNPALATGGSVQFLGGNVTFGAGSTYNPSGKTTISGGNVVFNNGSATMTGGLDLLSGSLGGTAPVTVPGTFNWSGGTLTGNGALITDGASTITGLAALQRNWQSATALTVSPTATLVLGGGSLTAPTLSVNGLLKGIGTISGNVINSGTVAPGASPGVITIVGNYTQSPTGVLQLELGGLSPGAGHDQLVVTGNAFLDGTLQVLQFGSFIPGIIDTFRVITAGSTVTGSFSSVNVPLLFAGLRPTYGSQVVELGGAVGIGGVLLDPRIVREDKDIFALADEDKDIFKKLEDFLVCN